MNLASILTYLEATTEVMQAIPGPTQVPAALALTLEKIFGAALTAHAASKGKTVEEIIAGLHQITPIP